MSGKPFLLCASLALSLLLPVPVFADLAAELDAAEYKDTQFIKDEEAAVKRAAAQWGKALGERDPIKIAALYENPFILYATFKTKVDTMEGLVNYFKDLTAKEGIKVVFNEQNIRVFGPTAINSGTYTFSYKENGKVKEVGARFTFVYALAAQGWRIVDHHSSVLPE